MKEAELYKNEQEHFNFGDEEQRTWFIDDHNFSFGHFVVNNGVATVGGFRIKDKLYYGVSICSPVDNFSKIEGRANVIDNLIEPEFTKKRGVYMLNETTTTLHPNELLKLALERHLAKMRNKPEWLQGAGILTGFG